MKNYLEDFCTGRVTEFLKKADFNTLVQVGRETITAEGEDDDLQGWDEDSIRDRIHEVLKDNNTNDYGYRSAYTDFYVLQASKLKTNEDFAKSTGD